jgi:hypothetical protein
MRDMVKKHSQILLSFLKEVLEKKIDTRRFFYDDADKLMKDYYSLRNIVKRHDLPIEVSKLEMEIWLTHLTHKDIEDFKKKKKGS